MHPATLSNFFNHCALGPLTPGLSPETVRETLGNPAEVSISRETPTWKYGSLQVSFARDLQNQRLVLIAIYYYSAPLQMPDALSWHGWWPTIGTNREEFCEHLLREGISYVTNHSLTFDDQVALKVGQGVDVVFSHAPAGDLLDSIQCHTPFIKHDNSPRF